MTNASDDNDSPSPVGEPTVTAAACSISAAMVLPSPAPEAMSKVTSSFSAVAESMVKPMASKVTVPPEKVLEVLSWGSVPES